MDRELRGKINRTIRILRRLWRKTRSIERFVAFSGGKDSLAMTALLYEAVEPERPICLHSHHDMEFPENLRYIESLEGYGFRIQVRTPNLNYFDLVKRGMGFVTLRDAWCVPMLVGTAFVDWLQEQGLNRVSDAIMFRGISGSEHSQRYHQLFEVYRRLRLPCFNPMLDFTSDEIRAIIRDRYGLPLNPLYDRMTRNYCICCYTNSQSAQGCDQKQHASTVRRYYAQIDRMLFRSGLVQTERPDSPYSSRQEKLARHGFVHWRRTASQNIGGVLKQKSPGGVIRYWVRDARWTDTKHLAPLRGKWTLKGNEIRFWNVTERQADTVVKRMVNCLDCGFCAVQCLRHRRFDKQTRKLVIEGCVACGQCISLKHCMGWRHRFWRRTIHDRV